MLETLISSRIRRTLLEHILAHPDDRFYLRGLAKTLSLSVSPVRRELLRLEQLGMLAAYEEGNMRFYVVNQSCAEFQQLKHAAQTSGFDVAPAELAMFEAEHVTAVSQTSVAARAVATEQAPRVAAAVEALPNINIHVERTRRTLAHLKALLGGFVLLAVLAIVFGSIVYTAQPKPKPAHRSATLATESMKDSAKASTSGEMRSSRWGLTPGTIGGGWSQ